MLQRAFICLTLLTAACGGSPPTQPTAQPPVPTPPAFVQPVATLTGSVTATNGGGALAGAVVEVGTLSTTTDGAGRYSLPGGTFGSRFTVSGPGLLTHSGFLATSNASRAVDLDAFALDRFDQDYFRAIAHNGYEAPTALQPLRRWTRSPMLYVRTIDDSGRAILPEVIQQVVTLASSLVPQYTGGRLGIAAVEQGTGMRQGQAGWITVDWIRDASKICGQAHVGQEGGMVTLTYDQPFCSCGSRKIDPSTVKHEFGHAMGLWHSGQSADLMSGFGSSKCDENMTPRELQYLDYLYRRPVGNTHPDNDPSSAARVMPIRVTN